VPPVPPVPTVTATVDDRADAGNLRVTYPPPAPPLPLVVVPAPLPPAPPAQTSTTTKLIPDGFVQVPEAIKVSDPLTALEDCLPVIFTGIN